MLTGSRRAVAATLHGVFGRGRRVAEDWDAGLAAEDAGLAQALLGLALRRWGRLQAWAAPRLKEPSRDLPLGTRVSLAVGLAQLAWLRGVASHAAVNEAVTLAADRELGFPPHRGLVNALLRQAAADRAALLRELEDLPAALDRTPFAVRVLEAAVGTDPGRLEALWTRLQQPPRPGFRAVAGPPPPGLEPDPELDGGLRLAADAPFPHAWLAEGLGRVQDRSSQALLAFALPLRPARVLDACAAPGGKTAGLAARFPDAELTALEREPARARRLMDNLARWRVRAAVVTAEAGEWLERAGPGFDLILLDAPCTGSGTLGKHPELTWLGGRLDLDRLAAAQRRLLAAAAARLAPGGVLLYAVCSWLPEEAEDHRSWLCAERPELAPVELWDGRFGGDGWFRPDPLTWDGEGFRGFALRRQGR